MLTISLKDPYTGYVVVSCPSSVLFHSKKVNDGRSTGVDQKVEDIELVWNDHKKDAGCIKNPRKQVKLNSDKVASPSFISVPFTQATHLRILCSYKFKNPYISHGHKDCVAGEADNV